MLYFRTRQIWRRLLLQLDRLDADHIRLDFDTDHRISVLVRGLPHEEQNTEFGSDDGLCEGILADDPPSHIRRMFEAIDDRRLPEGFIPTDDLNDVLEEDGRLRPDAILNFPYYPEALQEYTRLRASALSQHVTRTVKVLEWVHRRRGAVGPDASLGDQWSLDGEAWAPLSLPGQVFVSSEAHLFPSESSLRTVRDLVAAGEDAPLGRELFLEAWGMRGTAQRSSLAIAVAAAEVGFKEFVTDIVPETTWIMENVPAPPLTKLLAKYFPDLLSATAIDNDDFRIPQWIRNPIDKAVTLRNKVVHAGRRSVDLRFLEEVLTAVEELLWILDYFRGRTWAANYLTIETRRELGFDDHLPPPSPSRL
jgi:hypothetical protein